MPPVLMKSTELVQVPMVAAARGLIPAALRRLVEAHEGRGLGLFGEPRVNVLDLDMALGPLPTASR